MAFNEKVYTEVALSDSTMFKLFNTKGAITARLISAINNSEKIDEKMIEEQIIQIRRSRLSPLYENVINAFLDGDIVILFANAKNVLEAFPFFVSKTSGGVKSFIFINNYGKITTDLKDTSTKYVDIPMKNLYSLMEGAYIAREYALNPKKFSRSMALMKICADIYTQMFLRIFNKEYSLVMDEEASAKVTFAVAKFFLENVWEPVSSELSFAYARTIASQKNVYDFSVLNDEYDSAGITNIEDLIKFLATVTPRMRALTLRLFTDQFMRLYHPGALFSMETLPYFLFTVESAMMGAFIINQPIINDIAKMVKGIKNFYPELLKVL